MGKTYPKLRLLLWRGIWNGEEEKNRAIKEMQIRNTAIFQQQSLNIEKFKNINKMCIYEEE